MNVLPLYLRTLKRYRRTFAVLMVAGPLVLLVNAYLVQTQDYTHTVWFFSGAVFLIAAGTVLWLHREINRVQDKIRERAGLR